MPPKAAAGPPLRFPAYIRDCPYPILKKRLKNLCKGRFLARLQAKRFQHRLKALRAALGNLREVSDRTLLQDQARSNTDADHIHQLEGEIDNDPDDSD
mmetsp:Transcript_27318/g.71484  ORF Transcript_27318/g.71484 Transcript_27318/m.71484 type:complete len:98 (-) Transcript_27318:229-522(-)